MTIFPGVILFFSILLSGNQSLASELSLDTYLNQVLSQNGSAKGAARSEAAARETRFDSVLMTEPSVFFNFNVTDDKRPQQSVLFGNEIFSKSYQLGISEMTSFGLTGRLYYQLNESSTYNQQPISIGGSPAVNFSFPQASTGSPAIELTQSFWRNGFGATTKANQTASEAGALANQFSNSFKLKSKILDAELVYYRLAIARQVIALEKELSGLSQKTLDWANRRTRYNLGDRIDSYQAQAALQSRMLELQNGIDEERSASRAFNMTRGKDSDQVEEDVSPLQIATIAGLKIPSRATVRDDVKAAEQQRRAAESTAEVSRQNTKPQLDLTLNYSYNSLDVATPDAVRESFNSTYPYLKVGLAFSAPLDFGSVGKSQTGHESEKVAATLNYEQTAFEAEQNWKDLQRKFEESKRRLQMTNSLADLQKTKLDYERKRLNQGRTTAFQVLQFEQDYATAELNQVNTANQVLQLEAQMKLYRGE